MPTKANGLTRRLSDAVRPWDWILLGAVLLVSAAGLVTMRSFADEAVFFSRQLIWITLGIVISLTLSFFDLRLLRRTGVVVILYALTVALLVLLFVLSAAIQGAERWLSLGFFSFQPVELAKLVLIILLAKYFTRRHIEIARIKHIIVSGAYAFLLFILVLLQPDLGSALILFCIWLGIVVVAGISKKHLLAIFLLGAVSFVGMWSFVLEDYQKERVTSFLHPLADLEGAGYNAYQSMVAVGSGQLLGKGIGYGTQSELKFLPEHETDFIFASFAEEWGFLGVMVLLSLYGVIIWRLILAGVKGASNFETLLCTGVAIYFMTHITIHIGVNIGLLPITGTTIPFMSYGGSHLVMEFAAVGLVMAARRHRQEGKIARNDEAVI